MSDYQKQLEALLDGPAATPPAGVQSNFDDPANLNLIIYVTHSIALTLPTVAVFIRIYTRHVLLRSLGYDDYISVIAWLGLTVHIALSLFASRGGAGLHMWDMRLSAYFELLHWVNIVEIFYDPVNVLVKVSILLQYSRIFNPSGRKSLPIFIAIQSSIWCIVLLYFIVTCFTIFQCTPRENIWNKLATTGHCYDIDAIYKATGVFNVISDFAILILPLPSVWKLQMTIKRKLLVSGVFAVGFLTCVMSIMRSYYTWELAKSSDKSYMLVAFRLWSDGELSVGLVIGCFPVMPRFFQHIGPKFSEALSFRSKSVSNPNRYPKTRSKTPTTSAKPKNPFAKYKVGLSVVESYVDPYAQLDGEDYTLDELDGEHYTSDESRASQKQATMVFAQMQLPSANVATKRDDLEYAHPRS